MTDSYGSPLVLSRVYWIPPTVFATQEVGLTGLYEDMHPSGLPASLKGKLMTIIQIWGDFNTGSRLQPHHGDPDNLVPRQHRPSGSDPRSGQGDGSPAFF